MKSLILKHKKSRRLWKRFALILWAVFLILYAGVAELEAAGAEENPLFSFGSGAIKVRLYTDYFCPPCRDMEPDLEPLILDLVKDGTIHLTFIDVPTSRYTVLYANYFIYSLSEQKDIDSAIRARRTLFEAAEKKIVERGQLADLLTQKGIGLKPIDVNPVFNFWNRLLNEDQIRSTPSCVIVRGDLKETHKGSLEVLKALQKLKEGFSQELPNLPEGKKEEKNGAEKGSTKLSPGKIGE
jgi:thiol:disulfide interchange protein DsbA